jgi:hypothetical protein
VKCPNLDNDIPWNEGLPPKDKDWYCARNRPDDFTYRDGFVKWNDDFFVERNQFTGGLDFFGVITHWKPITIKMNLMKPNNPVQPPARKEPE